MQLVRQAGIDSAQRGQRGTAGRLRRMQTVVSMHAKSTNPCSNSSGDADQDDLCGIHTVASRVGVAVLIGATQKKLSDRPKKPATLQDLSTCW